SRARSGTSTPSTSGAWNSANSSPGRSPRLWSTTTERWTRTRRPQAWRTSCDAPGSNSLPAVDLGQHPVGDAMALHAYRHAAVDGHLVDDGPELVAGHAVGQRRPEMQLPFVHAVERRQHGHVDDAAGAPVEG